MPAIASQLEVSMEEVIQVHKLDENIVCLVLNRPDKLNALTKPMWAQLGETMRALAHDESIRALFYAVLEIDRSRRETIFPSLKPSGPMRIRPEPMGKSCATLWRQLIIPPIRR